MFLDMSKLGRILESRIIPVQIPDPSMNMRVPRTDIPQIGLEMLDIYHVEPHDRGEETDIYFCDGVAEVVFSSFLVAGCEVLFHAIEGAEECGDCFFVSFLCGSKARFVDAVVDVVVDPVVCFINFGFEGRGEEVDGFIFLFDEVVELDVLAGVQGHRWVAYFRVKHSNDLTALVADDSVLLLVEQDWYSESSFVFGIHVKVEIPQMCESFVSWQWIWCDLLAWRIRVFRCNESPSFRFHLPMDSCVWDYGFEAFEFAND